MAGKADRLTEEEWHRKAAVDLFNAVWRLLDKRRRSKREDEWMVHAAHASRHHWGVVGTPVNLAIGEWQVSHVYAVLRREEPATHHARACLRTCTRHGIVGFPLAFAYEALARADALAGRRRDLHLHLTKAYEAGIRIPEGDEREEFFRQLTTVARVRPRRPTRGRAGPR